MATAREIGEGLLVPKTRKFLKGYSMALTRNRDEADDLEQETIYKALRAAHQFEMGTNLEAWLGTIMRSIFKTDRARRKISPIDSIPEADFAVCLDPDAGLQLEKAAEILEGLSKNTAGILLAKVLDDRAEKDIAHDFKIPVGTVKSRISRARDALREKLL